MISWLLAVFGMVIGVFLIRRSVSSILAPLQKKFLKLPEQTSILKMLIFTKLCDVSQGSFLQNQYSAVALINSRSFSRRYSILLLCLSAAGLWTTMAAMLLTWQSDGYILAYAAIVILAASFWLKSLRPWFYLAIGLYFFLRSAMMALKNQDALLSLLGESDFHFWLADGRFPAQLSLLAAVFALTFLIRMESWSVFLALALLGAGSLSLNGAIAMVIGELLSHVWMLMWRSRNLNQDTQKITRDYAISSTLGLVLGFFLVGGVREVFSWGVTFDANPLAVKSLQFFTMYVVLIASQSILAMCWGHFAAQKKIDEVQKGDYFSIKWLSRGLLSNVMGRFIVGKLNERLDLLMAQKKDLNANDRAQIPQMFLKEHDREVSTLSLWLPLAAEALKPRKLL